MRHKLLSVVTASVLAASGSMLGASTAYGGSSAGTITSITVTSTGGTYPACTYSMNVAFSAVHGKAYYINVMLYNAAVTSDDVWQTVPQLAGGDASWAGNLGYTTFTYGVEYFVRIQITKTVKGGKGSDIIDQHQTNNWYLPAPSTCSPTGQVASYPAA